MLNVNFKDNIIHKYPLQPLFDQIFLYYYIFK
jgi:hypothetical protein